MRSSLRTVMTVVVTAATILGSTPTGSATETETVGKTKATYEQAELVRNLGHSLRVSTRSNERITFKVDINTKGDVTRLVYSHTVTSQNAEKVNDYVRQAYNAIMATQFTPATLDGEPVKDTIQIEFDLAD